MLSSLGIAVETIFPATIRIIVRGKQRENNLFCIVKVAIGPHKKKLGTFPLAWG